MMTKRSKVVEEKLLNEMWILLEYSNSFKEFVKELPGDIFTQLFEEMRKRNDDGS